MYGTPINKPDRFEEVVTYVTAVLEKVKFDVLVFRGFSGALVGPTVAAKLGKPWALIRKSNDHAHSSRAIEGEVAGKYVIIDDFIDTGATVRAIIETISQTSKARCIGVALYEEYWCKDAVAHRENWEDRLGGPLILNFPKRKK